MNDYIDIVFDAPPGPVTGRFVEVEASSGKSIGVGEWVRRPDGFWALRIPCGGEITKLDYFAGQALAGLVASSTKGRMESYQWHWTGPAPETVAQLACTLAKAMLRERKQAEVGR